MKVKLTLLTICLAACTRLVSAAAEKPNIIYILTDDLGYGDVQYLNPERGKSRHPRSTALPPPGWFSPKPTAVPPSALRRATAS